MISSHFRVRSGRSVDRSVLEECKEDKEDADARPQVNRLELHQNVSFGSE